jgi:hypothetical protein
LNVTHLFQRIHLDLYGHSLFALKIIELWLPGITKEPESFTRHQ